jgi:pimeloyl-ACP methyl ester carboxylesterase
MTMSEVVRTEWLATYHEGDSRLRDKRHGIFRLNPEKKRIEFTVQTTEAENSPIIIVSYPINFLIDAKIIEKRQKVRKHDFLELELGRSPDTMKVLFSFSIDNLEKIKGEILSFKDEMIKVTEDSGEKSEDDVLEVFARLLMTPLEQFQNLIGDVTSRLKSLTIKPKKATKAFISLLEPQKIREPREYELNNRKITVYDSSESHKTLLIILSPIGGKIDDFYPVADSLKGEFRVIIYGLRGYTKPIEQDFEFKLKKYIEDVQDFLKYLGPDKDIILCAHSLFSSIILEEFLDEKYVNIKKFILISGLHRAPDNFRKGVKAMPPYQMWGPFKGQVKKIAPKILFSADTEEEITNCFVNQAFVVPDKVYYQVFKDILPKYDYLSEIQTISKPLLVLWGKNDQLIPPEMRSEMQEGIPTNLISFKEIKGGHMIHLESPKEVAREINFFLNNRRSSIQIN